MRSTVMYGAQPRATTTPTNTVFASDTFTEGSDSTIELHTSDSGHSWTNHPQGTNGASVVAAQDRVLTGSTMSLAYISGLPATADYDVSIGVIMLSDNNSGAGGVVGRLDTVAQTGYHARYNTNGNAWQLYWVNAGTFNLLGSSAATLTVNQEYLLKLQMRGSTIKLFVDGAELVSATDANITTAGRAGLRMNGTSTTTTGVIFDNFEARNA